MVQKKISEIKHSGGRLKDAAKRREIFDSLKERFPERASEISRVQHIAENYKAINEKFTGRNLESDPLSPEEKEEYYYTRLSRNFGVYDYAKQEKIRGGRVGICGQGCVGEWVAHFLAQVGIGHLTIVDYDTYELGNGNRNASFAHSRLGKSKVEEVYKVLRNKAPDIEIVPVVAQLTEENAREIFKGHDIVVQAVDNMPSRVMIHRVAREMGLPCVTMSGAPRFRSFVSTVLPGGIDYETMLNLPTKGRSLSDPEAFEEITRLNTKRAEYSLKTDGDPVWAELHTSNARPTWSVSFQRTVMAGDFMADEVLRYLTGEELRAPAPRIISINVGDLLCPVSVKEMPEGGWNFEHF